MQVRYSWVLSKFSEKKGQKKKSKFMCCSIHYCYVITGSWFTVMQWVMLILQLGATAEEGATRYCNDKPPVKPQQWFVWWMYDNGEHTGQWFWTASRDNKETLQWPTCWRCVMTLRHPLFAESVSIALDYIYLFIDKLSFLPLPSRFSDF